MVQRVPSSNSRVGVPPASRAPLTRLNWSRFIRDETKRQKLKQYRPASYLRIPRGFYFSVVTNQIYSSVNLFATPARGPASAGQRCARHMYQKKRNCPLFSIMCPQQESNSHLSLRTGLLYPLSYEGLGLSRLKRNVSYILVTWRMNQSR